MRSLTLWPEWAFAMCVLGKDWENRPRPAFWYGLRVGDEFAIHAGAHLGGRKGAPATWEGLQAVAHMAVRAGQGHRVVLDGQTALLSAAGVTPALPSLGVADGHRYHVLSGRHYPAQQVVAVATLLGCQYNEADAGGWRVPGQYGFHLRVRALPTMVSCSVQEYPGNRQGLWSLPGPVEAMVRAQLAA